MPLLTHPTVPPGGPGRVLSLPFPLVNSGTSPLLGTVLGTEVGMEMMEVKLPGQGVLKEKADSPPALLLCPGEHSVGSRPPTSYRHSGAALPISTLPSRARQSSSSSPFNTKVGRHR